MIFVPGTPIYASIPNFQWSTTLADLIATNTVYMPKLYTYTTQFLMFRQVSKAMYSFKLFRRFALSCLSLNVRLYLSV